MSRGWLAATAGISAVSRSLLKNARIPRRYVHCELSNFDAHTTASATRCAGRRGSSISFRSSTRDCCFYGDNGVGKTHLAVALMKEAIRRKGARAVFFETRDLLKLVRDTYNNQVEATELDVLRPVLEAELLVLDDIGAEKKSPWVEETLGLVVNTRYSERRVTVFTTNLSDSDNTEPNSVALQLGLRIRSRLKEMCDWVRRSTDRIRARSARIRRTRTSRGGRRRRRPRRRIAAARPAVEIGRAGTRPAQTA